MMNFQPRFLILGFYAAGWLFVLALILAGVPMFFVVLAVLIQLLNTAPVSLVPVRVSLHPGEIECHFPLRATTRRFPAAETEWIVNTHPIRVGSFSDRLVLSSGDSKAVIWRMGVRDFDGICHELRTAARRLPCYASAPFSHASKDQSNSL